MKQITRILLLTVVVGLLSCDKYLGIKNSNLLAVPETLEHLQALLDDQGYMNVLASPSLAESAADDYFRPPQSHAGMFAEEQALYRWAHFRYGFPNDWSNAYRIVYHANFCLDRLQTIPTTAANRAAWEHVRGSALFFRAYHLLNLAWTHLPAYDARTLEEPGLVLRTTSDFNVSPGRSSLGATYAKVVEDARASLVLLPDLPRVVSRPSKAAAYGLLARAYLSMRDYDQALFYADASLGLYSALIDYNKPEEGINITANVPFAKYNRETVFYTDMNRTNQVHLPASGAVIDTALFALYDAHDLRKRAFFMPSGAYQRFKGSYSQSTNWLFTGIATDELYLIRAECRARSNDLAGARTDLGHLLRHRWDASAGYPGQPVTDQATLVQRILDERRKELVMRGLRWMDVKRLNAEGAGITLARTVDGVRITLEPGAAFYALPMPDDLFGSR